MSVPFSIIVATWNSSSDMRALLETAHRLDGTEHEWVIVDNGSSDDTCDVVRELLPTARLIETGENLGFAKANNLGVREASHPVCVLLNPDCVLLDDTLARLADVAAAERALVGPRILNVDRSWQSSAHAPLATWHNALSAVVPGPLAPSPLRRQLEPWRVDRRSVAGWVTAACLAASRELMVELGPFEEHLHMFGEDVDLGLRAGLSGVPSVFAPDVGAVVHVGGSATARRYSDSGLATKIGTRRWVINERLGPRRLAFDDATQTALLATRYAAKRALGRPADYEGTYLRLMRRRGELTAVITSPPPKVPA